MKSENINTADYWDHRFSSGDWESKQGRWQTESFARGQMELLQLPREFRGSLLDFGCGLGDALPVYREYLPQAELYGIDISESAIALCKEKYGEIGHFISGSHADIPNVDVSIASNVFEHLDNDEEIAKALLKKCSKLYVVVPYKEWPLCPEHVNSYDESSFSTLVERAAFRVFPCKGWTPYGFSALIHDVYIKNIFRFFQGKRLCHRAMQIMFEFNGSRSQF